MAGGRDDSDNSKLPLGDEVYISDEEDTFEKMKRGLKKFGKDMKKGAEDFADSSKKLATKSKEKMEAALEERKRKKAMKDPLTFPWTSLTVPQLKERLREMGLAVSGKKDQLVERIIEHYRTEIPTDEDGTPHLIEDLEPFEETPSAPDLDELVKSNLSEELVDEVPSETPLYQFVDSDQLYVHDPILNSQKREKKAISNTWRAKKIISSINIIFSGLIFLIMLSLLDYGFDMGFFGRDDGLVNSFANLFGTKLLRPYGGMSDLEVGALAGMLSVMLFMSSMLFFTRIQPKVAALMVNLVFIISLGVRIYGGLISDSFDIIETWGYLIFDLLFIIPFSATCWVPAMVVSEISFVRQSNPESFQVTDGPLFNEDTPQSITGATLDEQLGEDMSRFDVERPQPPRRRRIGQGSMYETIFLFLSLAVFWPIAIGLTLIIGGGIETRFGIWTLEEQGLIMLGPIYAGAIFCSYLVYRIDKEARSGEIYAKEKLAYHRDMDQYLELKRVYYESEAAKVAGNNGNNDDE